MMLENQHNFNCEFRFLVQTILNFQKSHLPIFHNCFLFLFLFFYLLFLSYNHFTGYTTLKAEAYDTILLCPILYVTYFVYVSSNPKSETSRSELFTHREFSKQLLHQVPKKNSLIPIQNHVPHHPSKLRFTDFLISPLFSTFLKSCQKQCLLLTNSIVAELVSWICIHNVCFHSIPKLLTPEHLLYKSEFMRNDCLELLSRVYP